MRIPSALLALAVIVAAGAPRADLAGQTPARPAEGVHRRHRPGLAHARSDRLRPRERHPDTWKWDGEVLKSTGVPIGVMRTRDQFLNFELVVEWRHLKAAATRGVRVGADEGARRPQARRPAEVGHRGPDARPRLPPVVSRAQPRQAGQLVHDQRRHLRGRQLEAENFEPRSPDGSRSFPRKELSHGVGEWNHYYVRGVNGEIRLWVNGEEVSGGRGAEPRTGFLCLEAEGSPVEFRNIPRARAPVKREPLQRNQSRRPTCSSGMQAS